MGTATVAGQDEFFPSVRFAQIDEGGTALLAAAFSYDVEMAREQIMRGANLRARDRRGAEPLQAAVVGSPSSPTWNPARQCEVIRYLIDSGAEPHALASSGLTPPHRAVRNRCSGAVETLLQAGADPYLRSDSGFTVRSRPVGNGSRRIGLRCSQDRARNYRALALGAHPVRGTITRVIRHIKIDDVSGSPRAL